MSPDPYYNLGNRIIGLYEINTPNVYSIMQQIICLLIAGIVLYYFDPFGLMPLPEEALEMIEYTYNYFNDNDLNTLSGGWEFITFKEIDSNFDDKPICGDSAFMAYFKRTKEDGEDEYVVVNKGTNITNVIERKNNFKQPFGKSNDMQSSIDQAKDFANLHRSNEITFVGHSKGGAEALANGIATNRNVMTFNAASANLSAYKLGDKFKTYTAKKTTYIVMGDVLNNIFGSISTPLGEVIYIPGALPIDRSIFANDTQNLINSVINHLTPTISFSLKTWRYLGEPKINYPYGATGRFGIMHV